MRRTQSLTRDALPFLEAAALLLVGPALLCSLLAASHQERRQSLTFLLLAVLLSPAIFRAHKLSSDLEDRSDRALAVLAVAWLFASVIASVPLYALGALGHSKVVEQSYGSVSLAVFEGVSGLTSTGLTTCATPAELPRSVQFWRSSLQWVGGIGLAAFIAPYLRRHRRRVFTGEVDVPNTEPNTNLVLRWALGVYLAMTVICFWLLLFCQVSPWEALNHAMSASATGGFTITNQSLEHYGAASLAVVGGTILVSGSSLLVWVNWARGEEKIDWRLMRTLQLPSYLAMVLLGGLFCFLLAESDSTYVRFRSVFNWLSAASTSGFSASAVKSWSSGILPFVLLAMFVGSCHSSTGGGIKHSRFLTLLYGIGIVRSKSLKSPPKGVVQEALFVATTSAVLLIFVTPFVKALEHVGWSDALFDVTSALGGVGLTAGAVSSEMSSVTACLLSGLMLLGRLEVVALLLLVLDPLPAQLPRFIVEREE